MTRFEAVAARRHCDRTRDPRGAHGDPVYTKFRVEVEVVRLIDLAAVIPAPPNSGSLTYKIDACVVCRTTLALGVNDFDVKQHNIFAIGL